MAIVHALSPIKLLLNLGGVKHQDKNTVNKRVNKVYKRGNVKKSETIRIKEGQQLD
jgi:hypothetical protein